MMAMFMGGGELLMLLMMLCLIPLGIASFVFWICMLVSAAQNKGLTEGERIAWVLIVALLHFLGAIVYFFVAHSKRNTPLTAI